MLSDLPVWLNHFEYHAQQPRMIARETSNVLTLKERRAIARSLAAFQRGEESAGERLLERARDFATRRSAPQIVSVVALLIAEEQRHARMLGEFLDGHGLPRKRRDFLDCVFRGARHLGGFELAIHVLLAAELVGIVYYRSLESATRCRHLQALCRLMLADEHAHVGFESAVVLALRAQRSRALRGLQRMLYGAFFFTTVLAVWLAHRSVLSRAGHGLSSFARACRAQYDFYLGPAGSLAPSLRPSGDVRADTRAATPARGDAPARAQRVAKSCSAMLRNDLNSSALPEGSSRNIVACSPGAPLNRT